MKHDGTVMTKPAALGHCEWRFCIAPMMGCTDRHFRRLARLMTRHARLYTEMVVAAAMLRGPRERLLAHDAIEQPVALQLGGSDPAELALAARIGAEAGYAEINLNVGCPSDRVQAGRFGACLIAEPGLVAECVNAMSEAVQIPVTVKTRLGVDDIDSYEHLSLLIDEIRRAGCNVVMLHARKALLNFGTRANRSIPPLDYARVARIKRDFPTLTIVLNGGVKSIDDALAHLAVVDGVMLGRAVYEHPLLLQEVDSKLFDATPGLSLPAEEVLQRYLPYITNEFARGTPLRLITRHLCGLFHGRAGARQWRRLLSGADSGEHRDPRLLVDALSRYRATGNLEPSAIRA